MRSFCAGAPFGAGALGLGNPLGCGAHRAVVAPDVVRRVVVAVSYQQRIRAVIALIFGAAAVFLGARPQWVLSTLTRKVWPSEASNVRSCIGSPIASSHSAALEHGSIPVRRAMLPRIERAKPSGQSGR